MGKLDLTTTMTVADAQDEARRIVAAEKAKAKTRRKLYTASAMSPIVVLTAPKFCQVSKNGRGEDFPRDRVDLAIEAAYYKQVKTKGRIGFAPEVVIVAYDNNDKLNRAIALYWEDVFDKVAETGCSGLRAQKLVEREGRAAAK